MTTIQFLIEWALRSSILILTGGLLLRAGRVKDASIRLAAWTAILCGSLALPLLTTVLPKMPVAVSGAPVRSAQNLLVDREAAPPSAPAMVQHSETRSAPFDWTRAASLLYVVVAGALLLRLCAGLETGRRIVRRSRATGRVWDGIEIRESDCMAAPATLGIARPVILLPVDWQEWDSAKLDAVLAHERSHIRRNDPAVQLLSAIHRALVWHSPLSWFLHRSIVRVAEEASDDAAVAATSDRVSYAEVLLDFMRRGVRGASWQGVAMARYGSPDERIHRILDGTALSRGLTRWGLVAIVALGAPLAYVVAAARPQAAAPPAAPAAPMSPAVPATPSVAMDAAAAPAAPQRPATPPSPPSPQRMGNLSRYVIITSDDTTTGSWDSRDPMDSPQEMRAKYGSHFAWFRHRDGKQYLITDSGVLAELDKAMEPQKAVNRMQSQVNDKQSVVNQHQSDVNQAQSKVNSYQQGVNRRQDIINRLQSANQDDELIRRLEAALAELKSSKGETFSQSAVNSEQSKVNEMQSKVNAEQSNVNAEQSKVNTEQSRVSTEFNRRIQEIFEAAVQRKVAKEVK